jgi:hypothetical protein
VSQKKRRQGRCRVEVAVKDRNVKAMKKTRKRSSLTIFIHRVVGEPCTDFEKFNHKILNV